MALQILEVSPEQHGPGFRVHGSIRVVDQDTGQDMDPTGQLAAARGPGTASSTHINRDDVDCLHSYCYAAGLNITQLASAVPHFC